MLDHGSHIFVWLGRPSGSDGPLTPQQIACSDFAAKLSSGRFPVPEVLTIAEVCLPSSFSTHSEYSSFIHFASKMLCAPLAKTFLVTYP